MLWAELVLENTVSPPYPWASHSCIQSWVESVWKKNLHLYWTYIDIFPVIIPQVIQYTEHIYCIRYYKYFRDYSIWEVYTNTVYTISYKILTFSRFWCLNGVLKLIPCGYPGTTVLWRCVRASQRWSCWENFPPFQSS
jgi:hypothetical protein